MASDQEPTDSGTESSRRSLLKLIAAGSAAGVAGCGGDGDGTSPTASATDTDGMGGDDPTATETDGTGGSGDTETATDTATPTQGGPKQVSGQTLDWYWTANSTEEFTWLQTPTRGTVSTPYNAFGPAISMVSTPGAWGPWFGAAHTGKTYWGFWEDFTKTENSYTIKIKDDANWSDGNPITAEDVLANKMAWRIGQPSPEWVKENGALNPNMAWNEYEIVSDKEITFTAPQPSYSEMLKKDMMRRAIALGAIPTQVEPYTSFLEKGVSTFEKLKSGEIEWPPRSEVLRWAAFRLRGAMYGDNGWSEDSDGYDNSFHEAWRNPDNVVVNGAWKPKAINGNKNITLQPNEEFWNADRVNFDEVKINLRANQRANLTAMKAGSQDYYRGTVPTYTANAMPDSIEQRVRPSNGGLGFTPNFSQGLFSDRLVRQAVMNAISQKSIAQTVHQSKFNKSIFDIPGGSAHGAANVLGQDWIDNNLVSYAGRNVEKANSQMQQAGYSKQNGKWVDSEGNVASVTIPSRSGTPVLEPTFASELQRFGIDAGIQTYGGSTFNQKLGNGEFDITPRNLGLGKVVRALGLQVFYMAIRPSWHARWSLFPEDYEKAEKSGNLLVWESENFDNLTHEVPPIGQPDADATETFHPLTLSEAVRRPNTLEDYKRQMRKLAWWKNYWMPTMGIAHGVTQAFMDSAHFNWPAADSAVWQDVPSGEMLNAFGHVQANWENPEEGASVE